MKYKIQIYKILDSLNNLYMLNRDNHNIIVDVGKHIFILGEVFGFHVSKETESINYYGIMEQEKDLYDFEGHTCHFLKENNGKWELMEESTCFDSFWIDEIHRVSHEMFTLKKNKYGHTKDNKFSYLTINSSKALIIN